MSQPSEFASAAASDASHPEKVVLEALKIAHATTNAPHFLFVYEQLARRVVQKPTSTASETTPASSVSPTDTAAISADPNPAHGAAGPRRIRLICATRKNREEFFAETALGRSLSLLRPPGVEVRLFTRNSEGLPAVYNRAIAESLTQDVIFVFAHDDIHLCDFHWAERLASSLTVFDVVGLAGNRRRAVGQPSWLFLDEKLTRDAYANLSGVVGHGNGYPSHSIDAFGPAGQAVKLLDGLLLAVTSAALRAKSLRFDERFDFHFYDVDFCRQVELAGLTMGTWPLSVIHESKGNFASDAWRRAYRSYIDKWGE